MPTGFDRRYGGRRRRRGQPREAFPDRKAIEDGALDGQGLEIRWLRDPVDRFVLQVQGSGRRAPARRARDALRLFRHATASPIPSLGRACARGSNAAEQMTWRACEPLARAIRRLGARRHPPERSPSSSSEPRRPAARAGPIGGAGLPLTPLRTSPSTARSGPMACRSGSIRRSPMAAAATEHLARLMIAQDTGSAISARPGSDIFVGSGDAPGHRAGLIRHRGRFRALAEACAH